MESSLAKCAYCDTPPQICNTMLNRKFISLIHCPCGNAATEPEMWNIFQSGILAIRKQLGLK